ncbi:MAG: hypothetical protein BWX80_02288 [Candidatus Hydrogenedentes bacterium ADurb.Bin101]|nr:MAG: hypothetical protein BWX80_02288 [Candidatus Hydrogenedentes bacterium ADurb.Bin101]
MSSESGAKMTRFHKRRTVFFMIAMALFLTGMASLITGVNLAERHHRWRQASPVNFAVDLSQVGVFSGAFHHTCPVAQGTVLGLEISEGIANYMSYTEVLEPLQCTCRITDADGNQVAQSSRTPAHLWEEGWFYWAFPIAQLSAHPEGNYTLSFTVTREVQELADVPVRLIARYELGDAELLLEALAMLLGIALLFVATLIPIITGVRMIIGRHKNKLHSLTGIST